MKVILAGLPKTGTTSMAEALRILGYNVQDFPEQLEFFLDEYIQALEGEKKPDFKAIYKDIDAVTDTPHCYLWEEIKNSFPEAKVILTERDNAEIWAKSKQVTTSKMYETWDQTLWLKIAMKITPTGRKWWYLFWLECMHLFSKENISLKDMPPAYHKHNERVKEIIKGDDLLVYNVKQGWQPLCDFLGVDVPDVDFPRLNVKSSGIRSMMMDSSICKKIFRELLMIFALLFAIISIVIYAFIN